MATEHVRNGKLYPVLLTDEERVQGEVYPEHTANALLRQAVDNAKMAGTPIRDALIYTVGLPGWMVILAKHMDYHHLETLHRYLREGWLKRGITLAECEMLMKVKRFISDEIMASPTENETKQQQFHTVIETAVVRKADRPKKSISNRLSHEKGSWEAPDYDGNDPADNIQPNLWVYPIRFAVWEGKNKPVRTILRIADLKKLYYKKMRQGDASEIPTRLLGYEVKDWIRSWKPVVGEETFQLPDKRRRASIERYKQDEIKRLRFAVSLLESADRKDHKLFWSMAWQYLGSLARVKLRDITTEKRIEHEIRRKFNAKKYRVEGIAYLPPLAAGEMLLPRIQEKIDMVRSKNAHLNNGFPWVIEVRFDSALREDRNGLLTSPIPNWAALLKHENSKNKR